MHSALATGCQRSGHAQGEAAAMHFLLSGDIKRAALALAQLGLPAALMTAAQLCLLHLATWAKLPNEVPQTAITQQCNIESSTSITQHTLTTPYPLRNCDDQAEDTPGDETERQLAHLAPSFCVTAAVTAAKQGLLLPSFGEPAAASTAPTTAQAACLADLLATQTAQVLACQWVTDTGSSSASEAAGVLFCLRVALSLRKSLWQRAVAASSSAAQDLDTAFGHSEGPPAGDECAAGAGGQSASAPAADAASVVDVMQSSLEQLLTTADRASFAAAASTSAAKQDAQLASASHLAQIVCTAWQDVYQLLQGQTECSASASGSYESRRVRQMETGIAQVRAAAAARLKAVSGKAAQPAGTLPSSHLGQQQQAGALLLCASCDLCAAACQLAAAGSAAGERNAAGHVHSALPALHQALALASSMRPLVQTKAAHHAAASTPATPAMAEVDACAEVCDKPGLVAGAGISWVHGLHPSASTAGSAGDRAEVEGGDRRRRFVYTAQQLMAMRPLHVQADLEAVVATLHEQLLTFLLLQHSAQ